MKEQEIIKRDIGLTFDFLRFIIDNPATIDKIPNGAELVFLSNEFTLETNTISPSKNKVLFNCRHTFEQVDEISDS